MINIEEGFLGTAKNGTLRLRVTLSNGERLSGVISEFGRYDVSIGSDAGPLTVSKKDISSISSTQPVVEPPQHEGTADPASRASRSRVQDEFLDRYIKEKTLALLAMSNGDAHRGVINGYDGFTVLLKTGQGQLLAYKHGLVDIGPGYRRS